MPCRREVSHFGVKVAIIEPGYFKTPLTNTEVISRSFQETFDRASPEVQEAYGEKFLTSSECSVDYGERSQLFSGSLVPSLEPLTFSGPSSRL